MEGATPIAINAPTKEESHRQLATLGCLGDRAALSAVSPEVFTFGTGWYPLGVWAIAHPAKACHKSWMLDLKSTLGKQPVLWCSLTIECVQICLVIEIDRMVHLHSCMSGILHHFPFRLILPQTLNARQFPFNDSTPLQVAEAPPFCHSGSSNRTDR